ncbi:MAG TPA: GNAT family N-acetyltransferase [Caulobacteraceae bacterium]|nr:GNAT family N-acetyltransferase [Caulobacteraceae bacterium]
MTSEPLLPDADLVRRCQAICSAATATRVEIVAARPGNPLGAGVRRFGEALATRVPPFGEHLFNTAFGFTDATLDAAGEVADWYAEAGVRGAFEITPGVPTGALTEMLHARGYRHAGFHANFAGYADLPQSPSLGVEVRQVTDETDLEAFSDAYHLGWSTTQFRVPMKPWLTAPGWSLYLGLCDGEPAGAAILSMAGGDAYLQDSAVDPKWRRRGVHRALLDRRCADAAAAGAAVVFSGANYLSASCRNMLRKGLGLLYTKAIWTAPAS